MTTAVSSHPWSVESLFAKAQLYVGRMESHPADDAQYGFWSALALELLIRAALAHISPLLIAEGANWRNMAYALGLEPTAKKFSPTSITTTEALGRLNELIPDFSEEMAGFCTKHVRRRNTELHTGELAFESYGTSLWLPRFFSASRVLLRSIDKELSDLFSDSVAAEAMISSLEDAAAKAVQQDIKAHAQVWTNKDPKDREAATLQADSWAIRQAGHRVSCPACASRALLQGNSSGPVSTQVTNDEVVQRQTMLPSSFECIACGLRILGLSKLSACGLGDAFSARSTYSAADFFGLYTEEELEEARQEQPQYEEDFNEF